MESDRISIRIPPPLMQAASARASVAGVSLAEWTRRLMEMETGVQADPKRGFASMTKRRLREICRLRKKSG